MWCRMSILMVAAATLACASAPTKGGQAASCTLDKSDSTYLKRGAVYRDCAVEQRAQPLDRSARIDYRPDGRLAVGQVCYSADVQFVVDANGIPEEDGAVVLRANNTSFGESALRGVAQWRYKPAEIQGLPVRQIVHETVKMSAVTVAVRAGDVPRPPTRPPVC